MSILKMEIIGLYTNIYVLDVGKLNCEFPIRKIVCLYNMWTIRYIYNLILKLKA